MAVYTLEIEEEYDFELIGISSHVHDYRLAWALNKHMEWQLTRQNDVPIRQHKHMSYHSLFEFEHELEMIFIALMGNKSPDGYLLPELQQFDYVLKIENLQHELTDDFVRQLRKTPLIQAVMIVDAERIKSRQNLIYNNVVPPAAKPSRPKYTFI
ncbi:MAG TPA: IPExxxVDY family protein [Flavobacteriales bacterium]